MENMVYKLKPDSWTYTGVNSFKAGLLGVVQGYTYGEKIDRYIKENSRMVNVFKGDLAIFRSFQWMANKRIRFTVEDKNVAQHALRSLGLSKIITADKKVDKEPLFYGFLLKTKNLKSMLSLFLRAF